LIGLGVSVAGNIGHIQPQPGHPVILADRLTAATSPVAAFAGLAIGLLVLKMTRQQAHSSKDLSTSAHQPSRPAPPDRLHALASVRDTVPAGSAGAPPDTGAARSPEPVKRTAARTSPRPPATTHHDLLHQANLICQVAAANGERISQRALARQLRGHGHRFSNDHLHGIAATIGLTQEKAA
jgi:hypothetical protein